MNWMEWQEKHITFDCSHWSHTEKIKAYYLFLLLKIELLWNIISRKNKQFRNYIELQYVLLPLNIMGSINTIWSNICVWEISVQFWAGLKHQCSLTAIDFFIPCWFLPIQRGGTASGESASTYGMLIIALENNKVTKAQHYHVDFVLVVILWLLHIIVSLNIQFSLLKHDMTISTAQTQHAKWQSARRSTPGN